METNVGHRIVRSGLRFLSALLAVAFLGCEDDVALETQGEENLEIATETGAISETDMALAERTLAPVRQLVEPDKVSMTDIEATYAETGTLRYTVHVFNPNPGGGVKLYMESKTSTGAIDWSHTFEEIEVTPIIDDVQQTPVPFSDGIGSAFLVMPSSDRGWYRLHFHYEAVNPGRRVIVKAIDDGSNPLPIAWVDPQGTEMDITARFRVAASTPVFFKGGVFRNTLPIMHAYVDDVRLDGQLLYRRTFDQGQFNFPLGTLGAGDHTLTFSVAKSAKLGKNWFGINETSFDFIGGKTEWEPAQFVYDGEMRTGDYDAWNEGVAFAQGASAVSGVRPAPVRRGTDFTVALTHPMLAGPWMNAILRIYPYGSGSETNWPTNRPAEQDFTGGIYTANGFESRVRENWHVSVPEEAPVGRYVLRAIAPNGQQVGGDVMFYVIFDPQDLWFDHSLMSPGQLRTWAYDEDWDGMTLPGESDLDLAVDSGRDHFVAMYDLFSTGEYYQRVFFTGAFKRTGDDMALSMLDYAVAAAQGATTDFDAMRRLYRVLAQRIEYGNALGASGDYTSLVINPSKFTPEDAAYYANPGTALPDDRRSRSECFATGAVMASIARAVGIPSRMVTSNNALGGWSNHGFAEAFLLDIPQHGGKTGPYANSPASDSDHWYTYDVTTPGGLNREFFWTKQSEAISTRSQYGQAALYVNTDLAPWWSLDAVTNRVDWNYWHPDHIGTTEVLDVTDDYFSGPEFWVTKSGVTGWIGLGEKDIYRISKPISGARAVRVRALHNDGEYLNPKLCVSPVGYPPLFTEKCSNASTHQNLPDGDAFIVVFNDGEVAPVRWGDSIEYILELEY